MKRLLNALPAVALALLPMSAAAASPSPSPSPALSPSLDHVLVAPPAGYVTIASSNPPNGHVTAHNWGQSYGVKSSEAERLLKQYGFVDGYNMTWASQATRHILTAFVLAFQGGNGASQWLAYDKGADELSTNFQHADTISGIPQYFGLHESESSVYGQAYLDGFVFTKGNDVIGVASISLADDNLALASATAKSQYAAAPASTIPPAQWPENANPTPSAAAASSGGSVVNVLPYALFGAAALVAILLGLALLLARVRKGQPTSVAAAAPSVSGNGPAPGTAVAPVALPLQMSADGNFWYDGERWVDATQEAPPFAPRSPDGAYWWDGYNWRQVPLVTPPVSGR